VSALADAAEDYLRLRNSLGHELAEYHRLLPRFVSFLDAEGLPTVTVAAALAWAQGPDVDLTTSIAPRRMTIARNFARYLAGLDDRTEVPPPGLVPRRRRWRAPFIYSPDEITALMAQARHLKPMPAATHETLIGLLAATGMRVGEAIRLDRGDIDWAEGVLTIQESKFGKTRMVPVLESTLTALEHYARTRNRLCPRSASASFFVSMTGTRLIYRSVQQNFRRLCDRAGIGAGAERPPRIHDLRHAFVVRTLLGWYEAGEDVEARLPTLSTYLGHRDPRSTYWYYSDSRVIPMPAPSLRVRGPGPWLTRSGNYRLSE
jgi:integrase/recombinase XerD